jgi:hypothetical protein
MYRLEFKQALNNYKNLSNLIKEVFKKDFDYFYIKDGKIKVVINNETLEITNNVLQEVIPDELVF